VESCREEENKYTSESGALVAEEDRRILRMLEKGGGTKKKEQCDSVGTSCVCVSGRSFLIPIKHCCGESFLLPQ